ncbi:hypothetical protein NVP1063O_215 [Vibrio phage 1.063.O._10N.261.45.C7]|nr:hypothetical protein NVP1063O_215 [Vibrio phage 1.063.O._10N.261.45.C7]
MKYYTLIGSRETPEEILELMTEASRKLAWSGWTGRSGGAGGADKCLEYGCEDLPDMMEVFLPWDGFNGCYSKNIGYINTPNLPAYSVAQELAEELHPNWKACSRGARGLHTRNCMQILGKGMKTPSKFVLCYGIPTDDKGNVKGGTGQACRLAISVGVEILNLYHEDVQQRVKGWLEI